MLRKLLALGAIASLFVVSVAFANPAINKKHVGKAGLDGAKVNCGYCHAEDKGKLPKTKGQDAAAVKKGKSCAIKDCH